MTKEDVLKEIKVIHNEYDKPNGKCIKPSFKYIVVMNDSDGDEYYMIEQIEEKGHASDWVQNRAVRQFYNELKDKLDNEERIGKEG